MDKSIKKALTIACICIGVVVAIVLGIIIYNNYLYNKYSALPMEKVFVTDANGEKEIVIETDENGKEKEKSKYVKSDFDKWLIDTVGINWIPTYVVITDDKVIGYIRVQDKFDADMFWDELGTIEINYNITQGEYAFDLTDIPITSLTGETKTLKELQDSSKKLMILEVHLYDCPDCEFHDLADVYNIYKTYSGRIDFYRYYYGSNRDNVYNYYLYHKKALAQIKAELLDDDNTFLDDEAKNYIRNK